MRTLIAGLGVIACVLTAGASRTTATDEEPRYPIVFDNEERLRSSLGISLHANAFVLQHRYRYNKYSIEREFSADGERLVAVLPDGTAQVWNARNGRPLGGKLEHDYSILSVRFSHDAAKVATASFDKTARVWSASDGKPLTGQLVHRSTVYYVDFDLSGTRLLTVEESGLVHVWDIASGMERGKPMSHKGVVAARFDGDERIVSTTGGSYVAGDAGLDARPDAIIVWDLKTRRAQRGGGLFGSPPDWDGSVISSDATRELVSDDRERLRLRDPKTKTWVGDYLNAGRSPDLEHKCFYYGDGGISARVSDEFLQAYTPLGFTRTSVCMAVVSPIHFDPETGKRLATFVLIDPTAMIDRGGPFDADNAEELPFEFAQCFYRARPIEDCKWKYHPRTGRRLKHTTGEALRAELNSASDLTVCDPENPRDCAYAMYTDGAAGGGGSASALSAARGRPPRAPQVSPQLVRNRLAGRPRPRPR